MLTMPEINSIKCLRNDKSLSINEIANIHKIRVGYIRVKEWWNFIRKSMKIKVKITENLLFLVLLG